MNVPVPSNSKNGATFEHELTQLTQPELADERRKKSTHWIEDFPFLIYYDGK